MPILQEIHDAGDLGTEDTTSTSPKGLRQNPNQVAWTRWCRHDWDVPVGYFIAHVSEPLEDQGLKWRFVHIPILRLSHKAALLVLQGRKLSDILIPNHYVSTPTGKKEVAHILLKASWYPWKSPPRLEQLILARLDVVPEGMPELDVLGRLIKHISY